MQINYNNYIMKKTIEKGTVILFTIASFTCSYGQVFQKNADGFKTGTYTRDQLKNDWQTKSGNGFSKRGEGEDRVSVIKSSAPDTGNALKVKYPKGKADSKESGAQWETDLKNGYDELYLSYDLKFSADFEFVKPSKNTGRTGKLPGLGGGLSFDDKDDRNTAWDGKLQFRDKDELEFYVKTPVNNEKHFTWTKATYTIAKNKWFNIEIRYKLNSVGKKDGIMQAWVNGKLLGEYKNAEFRDNAKVKINKMFFSTFYGGNPEADAPTKDVYAYFDNFIVDTKRINKQVGASSGDSIAASTTTVNNNEVNTPSPNTSNSSDNNDSNTSDCKGSTPKSISNRIQAETYCKGKGVSKKESYVTSIEEGDYMEYFVNIPSSGDYDVRYRVASNKNSGRGKIRLRLSGNNKGDIAVPNTDGVKTWKTIRKTVNLDKGNRTIRIQAVDGGGWNFDHFEIRKRTSRKDLQNITSNNNNIDATGVFPNPSNSGIFNIRKSTQWTVFTIMGNLIASGTGSRIDLSNQRQGLYLLQTGSTIQKIIIP